MLDRLLGFFAVALLVAGLGALQAEQVKQSMLTQLMKVHHAERAQ